MAPINPDHGWQSLERHLAKIHDPRRRAVLACVRDHLKAEAEGHFAQMLGTLAADPNYHFWVEGNGFGNGPKGRGAVQAHYEGLFREGRHVCDWDIDRIVVDEDTVVTEGWFDQLFPGKVLAARHARERGVPYLGLCLGLQCGVIEFARDVRMPSAMISCGSARATRSAVGAR